MIKDDFLGVMRKEVERLKLSNEKQMADGSLPKASKDRTNLLYLGQKNVIEYLIQTVKRYRVEGVVVSRETAEHAADMFDAEGFDEEAEEITTAMGERYAK